MSTVCTGCGEGCTVVEVDFGVGHYEYWGAPGFHRDVQRVSNCCEAPIRDDDDQDYEPEPAARLADDDNPPF